MDIDQALPVVCIPTALSALEREQSGRLREALSKATVAVEEQPDGLAFELSASAATFQTAAEWIGLERRCCPFLSFTLEWGQGPRAPRLILRGPEGTKEFLRDYQTGSVGPELQA